MYDPQTVAFEIKYPWRAYGRKGSSEWARKYHSPFITIWHVDPERDAHKKGTRGDDTCGWFRPPSTPENRALIRKVGEQEWGDIFGKRAATAEGKSYADICFEPTTYDAIYWAWRRIKHEMTKRQPIWKYGLSRRRKFSASELEEIYSLASNPVDNLQSTVAGVNDAGSCGSFFLTVYSCFLRYQRPWYRHPRWHFWHWKLQIHPLQKLKRRLFDRCAVCGKPFGWNESPIGNWGGDKLWHSGCDHVNHVKASAPVADETPVPPPPSANDLHGTMH